MIDFELHHPQSLEEAFDLLETHGDDARIMAGGTALILQMKQRLAHPEHVICLRRVPGLDHLHESADGNPDLEIGARCTQQTVATSPLVRSRNPLVAETYQRVATPRIRYMATVGGGLAHCDPSQDPPPTLIALGASVVLTSAQGQRIVPVEDLFVDYYETDVRPGEVITTLLIPPPPSGSGGAYLKFLPRTADDYATVSVAAVVTPAEGDICREVRVALGAVDVTPVRATVVEDLLRGQSLTEENIRAAAASVKDVVEPLDDYRGSAEYKRDMAEVFTRRAIQQALARARSG